MSNNRMNIVFFGAVVWWTIVTLVGAIAFARERQWGYAAWWGALTLINLNSVRNAYGLVKVCS